MFEHIHATMRTNPSDRHDSVVVLLASSAGQDMHLKFVLPYLSKMESILFIPLSIAEFLVVMDI